MSGRAGGRGDGGDRPARERADARGGGGSAAESGGEAAEARRALAEERERSLRLLADFQNFRRRSAREQEAAESRGRRAALRALLPVLDALEHALQSGSSDPVFHEGVAATRAMFRNALRQAGAEPVPTAGVPFDPEVHEAVAAVATREAEPGMIASEVRSGWRLGDELLRPAQVVVAAEPGMGEPWP